MRRLLPSFLGALAVLPWIQAALPAAELSAGVATVDITPPRGYRMAGYFSERINTGTRDPLHAKALALRQGNQQAALVFCDLIGIARDVSQRARAKASEATGIPAANIAIAATHSHTGPEYHGMLRNHFHARAIAQQGRDPYEEIDYQAELVQKLVDAIAQAQKALVPVRLEAGVARATGLSFNRRFHMKDGTVRFNPGPLNPEIVRPAGPIDPDVGVVLMRGVQDPQALAGLTVFALHLDTVGGTAYSADYPRTLETELRRTLGPRFVSLFGAGTCGDINHIDVTSRERASTESIGTRLAQTVRDQLPKLEAIHESSLAVASTIVAVPVQHPSADDVAQAREQLDLLGTAKLPFLDQVKVHKILDLDENYPEKTRALEVQVFRLGPKLAVVTMPGEVFVELGLAIKRASPFETTLVVELANDDPAYIPTTRAFAEGSYEVVNSRVAPGGGEKLVEAAVRLLKELSESAPRDRGARGETEKGQPSNE